MILISTFRGSTFLLCLIVVLSVTCIDAIAQGKSAKNTSKTTNTKQKDPSYTLKKYIDTYLKQDWDTMMMCDASMATSITNSANRAPQSLRQEEYQKALQKSFQFFYANEKDKLANGTLLQNVIGMFGGSGSIPLYKVLYPNMSYKVLEVRNKTINGPMDEIGNYSKEAFVELNYGDQFHAPIDNRLKVKKAVVKVHLQEWTYDYKVLGYVATEYSREYFPQKRESYNTQYQSSSSPESDVQTDTENSTANEAGNSSSNNNTTYTITTEDAIGVIKGWFK